MQIGFQWIKKVLPSQNNKAVIIHNKSDILTYPFCVMSFQHPQISPPIWWEVFIPYVIFHQHMNTWCWFEIESSNILIMTSWLHHHLMTNPPPYFRQGIPTLKSIRNKNTSQNTHLKLKKKRHLTYFKEQTIAHKMIIMNSLVPGMTWVTGFVLERGQMPCIMYLESPRAQSSLLLCSKCFMLQWVIQQPHK
jgi:hypothetical protein